MICQIRRRACPVDGCVDTDSHCEPADLVRIRARSVAPNHLILAAAELAVDRGPNIKWTNRSVIVDMANVACQRRQMEVRGATDVSTLPPGCCVAAAPVTDVSAFGCATDHFPAGAGLSQHFQGWLENG